MVLPASASMPALADDSAGAFQTSFAAVGSPNAVAAPASGAVDISKITPTIESIESDHSTVIGSGVASFYADRFNGRRTASGDTFNNTALTAAHRSLPFGTRLRVTNPSNGRSVIVRVNDRGPFHASRVLDLSRAAAERLGLIGRGSGKVELARLD